MTGDRNKIALFGHIGGGKTTAAAMAMRYILGQHAGQQGMPGHVSHTGGWETGPGGFHLEQASPLLKAAMDALGAKKFPAKTLPDAAKGELARFRWRNELWELVSPPGERLWTEANGIDVPALTAELRQYRVIVLTFQAPLLSVDLGLKFGLGMTEVYQLPQLGWGLLGAAENSFELTLGLSKEGLAERYPRERQVLQAHDDSKVKFNYEKGKFDVTAQHRGERVPAHPIEEAFRAIVAGEHDRQMDGLLARNVVPYVSDRVLIALSHVDVAAQFLPRVVTETDFTAAFRYLWGGVNHTSAQSVQVPNVALELQPNLPGQEAEQKAANTSAQIKAFQAAAAAIIEEALADGIEPKEALSQLSALVQKLEPQADAGPRAARIKDLDPTGAARLWTSIHHLVTDRRPTDPEQKPIAPTRAKGRWFNWGTPATANGKV
jgi:hypothetical protein